MLTMTTIQVRVDERTKRRSKKILNDIGLDMSSAVKLFLHQVIIRRGIPFNALTENGLTIEQEQEILRRSDEAKRGINVSPPFEGEAAIRYLDRFKR